MDREVGECPALKKNHKKKGRERGSKGKKRDQRIEDTKRKINLR